MASHFYLRFGETPWAIIDEKRNLCLSRGEPSAKSAPARVRLQKDGEVRLGSVSKSPSASFVTAAEKGDAPEARVSTETTVSMEDLWRLYHRSISNESRKNPGLQRQFMPKRYQKYLCELKKDEQTPAAKSTTALDSFNNCDTV